MEEIIAEMIELCTLVYLDLKEPLMKAIQTELRQFRSDLTTQIEILEVQMGQKEKAYSEKQKKIKEREE